MNYDDAHLEAAYEDRCDVDTPDDFLADPYDYDDAAYDGLDFGQDYMYDDDSEGIEY